ncbi:unnamed protein product [Brassica napus]|uniref:(rape) hypothetical protein n=1 Tax=Brassica napus TaxID=3708 RepID=A0A816QZF6_BRANA|nr:unnamed protein product [Brassica napus]
MDVFPAENEDGGYDRALPAEESDKDDDDEGGDLCRICRSPEGPDDPLRYPCACRGSIKYVHQECLRLWLNRSGYKQCEVCRRSYSFVPVYSENAPERLPCHEFVRGLSLRTLGVAAYVFVFLFNAFCFSLHPWGRRAAIDNQRVSRVSEKFAFLLAGFLYDGLIAYLMTAIAILKLMAEDILRIHREIHGENEPRRGGGGGVACLFWKSVGVLCDWWHDFLTRRGFFHFIMVEPREAWTRLRNPQLNEFGAVRRLSSSLSQENITGISHGSSGTLIRLMDSFSKTVEKSICVSRRLELVSDCPLVMILHWAFGQLCLLLVFNSMELIQKILQKRPFWFLLDVTDPNYKITKLYLGQFLFALAFHASLMVILVHLPNNDYLFHQPLFFPTPVLVRSSLPMLTLYHL